MPILKKVFTQTNGLSWFVVAMPEILIEVAINNCIRCHQGLISRMLDNAQGQRSDCLDCHGNVGHSTRK